MSRYDTQGIWWADAERVRGVTVRPIPAIPDTGWHAPETFPNLAAAKVLSIDCETKDPNLIEKGPGTIRKDGHIVGISVGTEDGGRWYFPMRHEIGGGNMDPENVLRWARDTLTRPGQTKVGANLLYDCDWLAAEGVNVQGPFIDVQYQEALLDENAKSYSLNTLGKKYLGEGKTSSALYEWCAKAYGGKADGTQRKNIWRAPAALVGPYAEGDVDLPLRINAAQRPLLEQQRLIKVASLENGLIPILLAMRRRGVRVDVGAAERVSDDLLTKYQHLKARYNDVDVWSAASLARACDVAGVEYPRTPTGKPSFRSGWLKDQGNDFLTDVRTMRTIDKMRGTFIEGHILGHSINGRIHTQFHPLRGDEYGTVSGRFSSSLPNLQNIPARDDELAATIRGMFLPEEGEEWWRLDWSQIEYRLLVHYARGGGADEARRMYRDDPSTDYHVYVSELTGIARKPAKNINFGLAYGMGVPKMAASLGRTEAETRALFDTYHTRLPFVKATFNAAVGMASTRGYTTTLLGRRRRFDLWEARDWDKVKSPLGHALPLDEARGAYGADNVRRAHTHKALNSILQGGAADIMKIAMLYIWRSGVCDVLGAPLLTVHDELGNSVPRTPAAREAMREVKHIMETCYTLRVPLIAQAEHGEDWGHLTEVLI